MRHEWLGVPEILMKRLITNAGVIICILIAGIFMEVLQGGEGFFKLTILLVIGLGFYFFNLCSVIFQKKYETLEGEVSSIQFCKGRKKYWEIGVMDEEGNQKQFMVSTQSGVRKGEKYRFYLKNGDLLGMEETS